MACAATARAAPVVGPGRARPTATITEGERYLALVPRRRVTGPSTRKPRVAICATADTINALGPLPPRPRSSETPWCAAVPFPAFALARLARLAPDQAARDRTGAGSACRALRQRRAGGAVWRLSSI